MTFIFVERKSFVPYLFAVAGSKSNVGSTRGPASPESGTSFDKRRGRPLGTADVIVGIAAPKRLAPPGERFAAGGQREHDANLARIALPFSVTVNA